LELEVGIEKCRWMIVENPEAVDKALAEFLDITKNSR
jgi:hypothetical protein